MANMTWTFLRIFTLLSIAASDESNQGETCEEDISSHKASESVFYGEASDFNDSPAPSEFRSVEKPKYVVDENAQFWVTFFNECDEPISMYWLNAPAERFQGEIQPKSSIQLGTFIGHQFFYRLKSDRQSADSNRLQITPMKRGVTEIHFKDPTIMKHEKVLFEQQKQQFKDAYYKQTGRRWLSYYPRDAPKLHMFEAEQVGQRHHVTSEHSFYNCYPNTVAQTDECKEKDSIDFQWVIQATSPKVMWLEPRFLSDFEIEHLVQIASKSLNRSTVGQGEDIEVSYSRTSKGAWVQRGVSEVVDNIFRRIADVTKIPESHLWPSYGCEQLQVLKYEVGEQFFPHPDYNTDKKGMRFITFLMYLNDVEEGGETEFPKANLKVSPKKGHVAAFYSVLWDGNADPQSLHAGLPIIKGTKWAAPLWIWDPFFER